MFSKYFSNFIHKFLSVYFFILKALNAFGYKIIFFKILFLKKTKFLVLINVYKLLNKNRPKKSSKKSPFLNKKSSNQKTQYLSKKSAKTAFGTGVATLISSWKADFDSKQRSSALSSEVQKSYQQPNIVFYPKKNRTLSLKFLVFRLERLFYNLFGVAASFKVKDIFKLNSKKNNLSAFASPLSLLQISKVVYARCKNYYRLRFNPFLKDTVNLLNIGIFYHKAQIVSDLVAGFLIKSRQVLKNLYNVKNVLNYFQPIFFSEYGLQGSIKIGVFGKLRGQKNRRFRSFFIKYGKGFSTQDYGLNLSYSYSQIWNIFGSFGVKVWLYKRINGRKI